jgi:hypothetical protein
MTTTDTSAEAVERLAAFHALSVQRYDADEESGLRACAHMTAATLRALLARAERAEAERDRLRAEVEVARRDEREACATVCQKRARAWEDSPYSLALSWRDEAECCAAAIRARGDA